MAFVAGPFQKFFLFVLLILLAPIIGEKKNTLNSFAFLSINIYASTLAS